MGVGELNKNKRDKSLIENEEITGCWVEENAHLSNWARPKKLQNAFVGWSPAQKMMDIDRTAV